VEEFTASRARMGRHLEDEVGQEGSTWADAGGGEMKPSHGPGTIKRTLKKSKNLAWVWEKKNQISHGRGAAIIRKILSQKCQIEKDK